MRPLPRLQAGPVARPLALVVAAACGALALGACQSTSVNCSGGRCAISFSGGTGSTYLNGSQLGNALASVPVGWDGTTGGTAKVIVGTDQGTCTQGQTLALGDFSVTCTKVTDQDLDLTVKSS